MAKVMISLPEDLLATLDNAAARASQTRSAFIRDALRLRLAGVDVQARRRAVGALRSQLAGLTFDPEDAVRAERNR
ncbi:MAG: ribbon-helix-helix protein, CopG family [Actinomycetota bacterium]|nr:ribbon-helix-helix protein, CopG family [Actinomycetota bacterium]